MNDRDLFYKSFYGRDNLNREELKTLNESKYNVLQEFYDRHYFKFDKEIDDLLKQTKVSHHVKRHSLHDFYTELLHAVEDRFGLAEYNYSHQNHKNATPSNVIAFIKDFVNQNDQISSHQKKDLVEYFDRKLKHCVGELIHVLIFLAMAGKI